MKYHNDKDVKNTNKVGGNNAGSFVPKNRIDVDDLTFEQRLHTDLFFGSGQTKKHIDLVKLGVCFMSLEEALEAIPQSTKKEIVNGKLVEVANKTQENWAMFQMAWRTFHAPNTGIPQMYIDMYQPELTGEQMWKELESKSIRANKVFRYQTIHLENGDTKQIRHEIKN